MRSICRVVAAALAAAAWVGASPTAAQMAHIPENDWRRLDRLDVLQAGAADSLFLLEVRLGPYLPDIDSSLGGRATPFADTFGYDCATGKPGSVSRRLYLGLEFDVMPVRVPYLGKLGVVAGWGFTRFSNNARLSGQAKQAGGTCAQQSTTLTIMPMHGSLVLRADELFRRTKVPLVPYGKAGVGLSFWRASTDTGTEHCTPTSRGACPSDVAGLGLTPSLHLAVGGMLALDFLDPNASARLSWTAGVHHVYLFGEWSSDTMTLGSQALHVGASTWVGGLAMEM